MKLFIIDAGSITMPDKSGMTPGRGIGEPFTFPVYIYLIEHPQGLVLFDTGFIVEHWPDFMKPDAHIKPELHIDRQLEKCGYKREAVKYVVLSHYHLDHCGGMSLFPEATFIIRREEAKEAWRPGNAAGYLFDDYKDTSKFNCIELADDVDYDIFKDGTIVCIDTKGHSRGHQSLLVRLSGSGRFVLAVDAASLQENLDEKILPGANIWSAEESFKSFARLRRMRDNGAFVIFGHDPRQREMLKIAPEYYE